MNKTKLGMICLLLAVAMLHTGCFLFQSTPSTSSTPSAPTVDYAPQNIRSGAYIEFDHPGIGMIHIAFQINSVSDNAACTANNGRINAAYYHYDGFNKATLTYNYSPNGGMSSQYKAELNFQHDAGGQIVFIGTDKTASFKYRP